MKISGIIWLKEIVDKLDWKHNLQMTEVEEVFTNRPQYHRLERGKIVGEDVYAAYGRTNGGRYVTIVFIFKAGSKALILSARDMDKKERKQYGRKN